MPKRELAARQGGETTGPPAPTSAQRGKGAMDSERFPMQRGPSVDMTTARAIYAMYCKLGHCGQSLKRVGERGGFGWAEVEHMYDQIKEKFGSDHAAGFMESISKERHEQDD